MPAKLKSYKSTLAYLFEQLPMFHRIGAAAYHHDLGRTIELCQMLGNPHEKFKSIHIGGTNGKGSTAHMCAAILQEHGFKVGLYTSPHYKDFRERIKINGKMIPRSTVTQFVNAYQEKFDQIKPSFFEWTVALAFDYFAAEQVDIAVIEVGMGGRFDSTNVIIPLVSVITNISLDHTQFLGDTLEKIAFEKAGIIKSGVPVVIGETQENTKPVFEEIAAERQAPIHFADREVRIISTNNQNTEYLFFDLDRSGFRLKNIRLSLLGDYQLKNLATVMQTLFVLQSQWTAFNPDPQKIRLALEDVRERTGIIGRWQLIGQGPKIICDSAHNEGGLRYALGQVKKQQYARLHIVMGMVSDKDISKMLALFPVDARYYFAKPNIPRGLDAAQLRAQAKVFGLKGRKYASVNYALQAAKRNARPEDLIYVGGSTFVVAEVI